MLITVYGMPPHVAAASKYPSIELIRQWMSEITEIVFKNTVRLVSLVSSDQCFHSIPKILIVPLFHI